MTGRAIPQWVLLSAIVLSALLLGCSASSSSGNHGAAAPVISVLTPSQAAAASAVKITGSNFGATQTAADTVTFNGKPATIISWNSFTIVTEVPVGATSGNVVVSVSSNASNGASFSVQNGTLSGCGTGSESVLSGTYAYEMSGFMGAGLGTNFARAGSFTANGAGIITSGDEDLNVGTLGDAHHGISGGSYSVGPDNRACLTLNYVGGGSATFRASLGTLSNVNIATRGHIIQFDDTSNNGAGYRASGVLLQQTVSSTTGSSLLANYSFGLQGADPLGGHVAMAGTFALAPATATNNITNGYLDLNDAGNIPFVGTTNSAFGTMLTTGTNISALTGRTTASYSAQSACAATTCTYHWAVYVVNANQFFLISTDALTANTPLVSGRAISTGAQGTFSNASVSNFVTVSNSGGYILEASGNIGGEAVEQLQQVKFTTASNSFATAGWTYSVNVGSITNTPNNAIPIPFTGGYLISTTTGRLAFSSNNLVVYLTTPGVASDVAGFVIGTDSSKTTAYSGLLFAQQGTTLAAGRYFLGTSNILDNTAANLVGAAAVQATTQAPFTYTVGGAADASQIIGLASSTFANEAFTFNAIGLGSATDPLGNTLVGIADGTALFYIDETPTGTTPVLPAEVAIIEQ